MMQTRLMVNEVKAKVAYVEQQRNRREEKTTRPSRFPINPRTNKVIHIQLIIAMVDNMTGSVCEAIETAV